MDALMKTSHPEIDRRQCWNLSPHRSKCSDCKDICPYGESIFARPNLIRDWSACTENMRKLVFLILREMNIS